MSAARPQPEELTTDQPLAPAARQATAYSYLLRLWWCGAETGWCASLQSVRGGERHMFPDLETLIAFLIDHVRSSPNE